MFYCSQNTISERKENWIKHSLPLFSFGGELVELCICLEEVLQTTLKAVI